MKKFNKIFPILILVILIIATFVLCSCDFSSTNNNRNNTNNEQSNSDDNNTGNNNGKNNNSGNNNGEGDNSNNNGQTPLEEEPVIEVTEGLEYVYLSESNSYKVSGFTAPDDNKIKVTIPESYNDVANGEHPVTSIGEGAFSNCSSLKSITIPSSVTSIGEDAFSECNSLTSITIPDSVTSIGEYAFYGCSKLESITLPFVGGSAKTESDFYQYPFGYIFGTSSYEGGIATEQYYYGSSTSSETSDYYYIPSSLKNVTITGGNILCGAFSHCSSLTSITILDSVTSIGFGAFFWCSNLTSIEIPSSVTSIGFSAFEGCNNIETANIPTIAISYIPKSKLKTVVLNSGTSIDDYAFYGCSNLTSITIPSSVTSIEYGAFGAGKLVEVYNKSNIDLTEIDDEGFNKYGLDYVKNIYTVEGGSKLTKTDDGFVIYTDGDIKELISYEGTSTEITIPNDVTSIGLLAFFCNINLTNITIPSSVTSIGSEAFSGCNNLQYNEYEGIKYLGNATNPYLYLAEVIDKTQTTYTIHNDTKIIGEYAFFRCSNLTNIVIPNTVTSIGSEAFWGCNNLQYNECEGLNYLGNATNPYLYLASVMDETQTTYTINDNTTIIGEAFAYCGNLISITIPSSVISIGMHAFFECFRLIEVYNKSTIDLTEKYGGYYNKYGLNFVKNIYTEENGSKLRKEGDFVIYADGTLKELISYEGTSIEITIPSSVTGIWSSAFDGCSNLTSITIPSSVTSIGDYAFSGCSNLTSITIPSSVTSMGNGVFFGCRNLRSITILSSITSIGDYAFYECRNLRSITIPSSVTSIGYEAFYNCSNLTSITIPSSVTSIRPWAFDGCSSLTIYCEATSEPSGWDSKWNDSNRPVYWYSEAEPMEEGNYWHYVNGIVTRWE